MGFISDEELDLRINKTRIANPEALVIRAQRDPNLEKENLTETEKILFGALVQIDGAAAVSEATGKSVPTVRNLAKGRDDFSNGADPNKPKENKELKSKVDALADSMKTKLQTLAHSKVEAALNRIDDTKLDEVKKATDLAIIASSLAKVASSFDEKREGPNGNFLQVQVFRPRMREEEEYEVIEVVE